MLTGLANEDKTALEAAGQVNVMFNTASSTHSNAKLYCNVLYTSNVFTGESVKKENKTKHNN